MIKYGLVCGRDHEFEGWFRDSAAFDAQASANSLSCPVCGDVRVAKAIMAPALRTSEMKEAATPPAPPDPAKVRQFMAGYRKFVEQNADYVGPKFPEEARKIHYGETDERHIYGESSLKEARELIEEGIEVAPLPPAAEDLN